MTKATLNVSGEAETSENKMATHGLNLVSKLVLVRGNNHGVLRAVYRFGCGVVVSSSWWNSCIFWVKIKYEFGGTYLQQLIKERLHLI